MTLTVFAFNLDFGDASYLLCLDEVLFVVQINSKIRPSSKVKGGGAFYLWLDLSVFSKIQKCAIFVTEIGFYTIFCR